MSQQQSPLGEFTEKTTYEVTVPHLSEDDLREFVRGVCDGQIFTSAHIREGEESMATMIFMPLALGIFKHHLQEEIDARLKEIGVFWEWMSTAAPRCVNGYPIFFSCHMLHADDWARAREAINAENKRRDEMPLPPPGV